MTFTPARYCPVIGGATTSAPEETSVIVLTSVVDMRISLPTVKIAEFATDKDVLPEDASAERLVNAVCT
jgi:hypothetical protein